MQPAYDLFVSYAHRDREAVRAFVQAAREEGVRVFFDETGVPVFDSIQKRIEQGIAQSRVLLAWYSVSYARSRACQWELAAAYLCGPGERVLVFNPAPGTDHIQPRALLDRLFAGPNGSGCLPREVKRRAAGLE